MKKLRKEIIKQVSRDLRRRQTESEQQFWQVVRSRKLFGLKFYRQHPIKYQYYGKEKFIIADFYCAEKKLIIEIDGQIHGKQKEYDQQRTYIINNMGIEVVRIKNEELKDKITLIDKLRRILL